MTDRKLMQQALDALEEAADHVYCPGDDDAIGVARKALRARLAQPEQEPVAWFMEGAFEDGTPSFTQVCETDPEFYVPLYTAPPQREWQGLTDQEQLEIMKQFGPGQRGLFADAIEAKLKEKNT